MAEFFLKLGHIDKKLIMIIITTILYFIMDIIDYYSGMSDLHFVLNDFCARAISYVLIIIVPIIQKCRNKDLIKRERRRSLKQIALDLFFIYLTYIIFFVVIMYLTSLKAEDKENTEDYKMSHYKGLCSEEALEIIFIIIVSIFLLKIKFYIHHYIGLLIFLVLSLGIDLLCDLSIFKPDIFFVFIYILYLILDSIYITYEKYMMDKLGYSPYRVVFFIGLLYIFLGIVFVIILSVKGGLFYDGSKYMIEGFKDYFDKNDYKEVIIHIAYLIFFRFFINILKILTVYYFSQIHTFTIYIFVKMFYLLIRKESKYKYYSLILFVFQLLALLIFLEIIELNFWNLDKNTKRNIERRESEENDRILSSQETIKDIKREKIEVAPGYYVETEMARTSLEDNDEDLRKTVD